MGKKNDKNAMIEFFQKHGYEILDYDFCKAKDKVSVKCKNGHYTKKSYNSIQQGYDCIVCSREKESKLKHTYEYIYKYFADNRCELLSKNYHNQNQKLTYVCSCGNKSTISFHNFKDGSRCNKCKTDRFQKKTRIEYDKIKGDIESYGLKMITNEDEYKTTSHQIEIQCSCGNFFKAKYQNLSSSKHKCCETCRHERIQNETINKNIKYILENFDLEVINFRTKGYIKYFTILCACGKEYETTLYDLKKSKFKGMCRSCSGLLAQEPFKKYTLDQVSKILKDNGWTLISQYYSNIDTPMKAFCDNGHETTFTMYRFIKGCRCKQCFLESEDCKGENHWNWRGGVTSKNETVRKSKSYIEWRNSVYKRDDYKCQCCNNKKSKKINAHHILNFSEHEDVRLDLKNGITLCEKCHREFHNIYGMTNNTPEQLKEYIKSFTAANNE